MPSRSEQFKTPSTEILTDDMIHGLRSEAGSAGDRSQVAVCERALEGDDDARDACAAAINDAALWYVVAARVRRDRG